MLNNSVSRLTVCKDNYDSQEEFENAIKKAVMTILDNGYIMTVKYDADDRDMGNVIIDYDYNNEELGGRLPYWLFPEEAESVVYVDEDGGDSNE